MLQTLRVRVVGFILRFSICFHVLQQLPLFIQTQSVLRVLLRRAVPVRILTAAGASGTFPCLPGKSISPSS